MSNTENSIKIPLYNLLSEPAFKSLFQSVENINTREQNLFVDGTVFKSDFSLILVNGGQVFIEDDDAIRCLSNFTKYWLWIKKNQIKHDVYIFHLIGPGYPAQLCMLKFLSEKAQYELSNLHHLIMNVQDWSVTEWIVRFRILFSETLIKKV